MIENEEGNKMTGQKIKEKKIGGGSIEGIIFGSGTLRMTSFISDLEDPGRTMYWMGYHKDGSFGITGVGFSERFEYLTLELANQYFDKINNCYDFRKYGSEFDKSCEAQYKKACEAQYKQSLTKKYSKEK